MRPVAFSDLDGWTDDDHAAAFRSYLRSCRVAVHRNAVCAAALALGDRVDRPTARDFFEAHFQPHAHQCGTPGFVTGYYEPLVRGARTRSDRFNVPVYRRPEDLITRAIDTERALFNDRVTGFRATADGEAPYFTRAEIEGGALEARRLELLYLDDWIELFFMQVQGSGLVQLDDGRRLRLSFAGKNGHPFTSIARVLIERGEIEPNEIDMERVKAWLRADIERGRALMQENRSYVFFRLLGDKEGGESPLGAKGVALTPRRSLAIDPAYAPLGCPIYLVAEDLLTENERRFAGLMIGQDVGSAIRGPQRGDIFWGTGDGAGAFAGTTRHAATFFFLLPKR